MPKKPLEILLSKIIKETLLLEEVNEEKISYHVGLMTSAVQSEEGKALIQSSLKQVVIGILKYIAILGSPSETKLANLVDTSMLNSGEIASQLVTSAEIDQAADPDLHDILVAAMAHFINAFIHSIAEEIPMWFLYGNHNGELRIGDYTDQMFFIDNVGNEILPENRTRDIRDAAGIRFAYEPNEKVEFMKKLAQVLMKIADDRFRYCWGRIPQVELSEYDVVGDLFEEYD